MFQNCPTDITRVTTAGSMVAVSWNPPSSSDNSGEYSMTVNDNHVSGDTFAIGVYNVIYTAMDPSGNAETCVFVITIEGKLLKKEWYNICIRENLNPCSKML